MLRSQSSNAISTVAYPMQTTMYDLKDIIGYGASAVVWRAICRSNEQEVAIKIIDLESCSTTIDHIRKEVMSLQLCRHPNVIKYHCSFISGHTLWLVMQYVGGGSCQDIIRYKFKTGIDRDCISTILFQVLHALSYLHQNKVLHRDIRSGNILIGYDGSVVLTDFGLSSIFTGRSTAEYAPVEGTLNWVSPEVLSGQPHTTKSDVWSLGITVLELARGSVPFANIPDMQVMMLILESASPTFDQPSDKALFSRSLKDLVDSCLQKDPSHRPSVDACLKHRFFKKYPPKKEYLASHLLSGVPSLPKRAAELRVPERAMSQQVYYGISTPASSSGKSDLSIKKYYENGMMSESFRELELGKAEADDMWDFGSPPKSKAREQTAQKPYVYIRS
eukprot:TRINITY_DN1506_c0_g1_i4.p1 TRINITY_DN1506_c0_g1~~TRINITY_DN1506_c0_g1_i4.p1  ORF type:complete len:390 (-),score=60.29 TRINITY_DN1506_c0_g1_i4:433-1602(-)